MENGTYGYVHGRALRINLTPRALALGLMENTMTKNEKIESLKELISEAKFQLTLPTFLQVSYSHEETNQTIKDATRQLNKLAQE